MVHKHGSVRRLLTVMLVAAATMLLGNGSAQAVDYPAPVFSASVNQQVVVSGERVIFQLQANVSCNWTTEWNGETRNSSGASSSATFIAPIVDVRTVIDGRISCVYADDALAGGNAVGVKLATWNTTIPVTVLPRGGAGQGGDTATASGDLPNTGGPSWYLLAGGLLLLVAGAGAVRASKRQPAEVEGN